MPTPKSEFAISELSHLEAVAPQTDVVMSFEESQGIRVAAWAVAQFGSQVLVQRVVDQYNQDPILTASGEAVHIGDVGKQEWQYALEEADTLGREVATDLTVASKRLERGYPLDSFSVRGVTDATAVIGSLERAVEVNPDNLSEGELYMQAAARYMLDHMQVLDSEPNQTVSYLL